MPLTSGTIPSMIGGISQQDASVRLPTQIADAVNCDLSPARGAGPRPPAEFINVLRSDIPDNAFFHSIVRDSRERYIVAIYPDNVRVFNHETGKEYVVIKDAASLAYLTTLSEPWQSFRAVTVDDYTFIVNRDKTVALSTQKTAGVLSGSVQTFQDLPKTAASNAIYEIRGDGSNAFDNYFVQYQSSLVWKEVSKPGEFGYFDSATMPHGLKRVPDGTNPDGFYFSYGPLVYDTRYAGDTASSPPPSIVGQRIGDVFFHRDRLGLIASAGNIVMSEIGHYFNFWRTTVTSLLDSDVIDVNAPTEGVAEMLHCISYQKALMIFASGKTSLFQLTGTPTLTPKTVKIDPVTTYGVSPTIKPVLAGSSLFFLDDNQAKSWSTVREYFVSDDTVTPEAADVTAHVPSYVTGNTRCMAEAGDADMLFIAQRNAAGGELFVHQYKWSGDTKQQSAWNRWLIQGTGSVLHVHAIGTMLYVMTKAPSGGVELLRLDLSSSPTYPLISAEHDIYLDRREAVTPVWQQFGNYTDITVPLTLPTLTGLAVLKTTDWPSPGTTVDLRLATLVNGGQTIRLPGRVDTGRVVVGYRYNRRITLSQQFIRDQNNVSKLIGRLQIKRMTVRYNDATYFKCLVTPKGRPQAIDTIVPQLESTFTNRTTGDAAFLLSTPTTQSGTYTFLVASRSDAVDVSFTNDSPFPAWFQSVQWEGLYTAKVQQ